MLRKFLLPLLLVMILLLSMLSTEEMKAAKAKAYLPTLAQHTIMDSGNPPLVDGNYIYDQLYIMATSFLHREAGYDTGLPPNVNGHDEFAHYWSQEIVKDLQGFGPQVQNIAFKDAGWKNRPTTQPGVNVEVTVPGAIHPEQVVIIGCHYDGENVSNQSAYDDASGCAIELGIAKAMAAYWHARNAYPTRTLRFVLFDAEEQGLFGSFDYVNNTVNGDLSNIVAMINQEQEGLSYPVRYLGRLSNPFMPLTIVTPTTESHLVDLFKQAIPAVFQEFQAASYTSLTYHNDNGQDVTTPIFTSDQTKEVMLAMLGETGGSDDVPFAQANVPAFTLIADGGQNPKEQPAHSPYPFDTKYDTMAMMNTYANGNAGKAGSLALALGLSGSLTAWDLCQPAVLGLTPAANVPAGPLVAISDVGQTVRGKPLSLNASAAFDPSSGQNGLTYSWNFGDGSNASGVSVQHTYTALGNFPLTLSVTSATGTRQVRKLIHVVTTPTTFENQFLTVPQLRQDGHGASGNNLVLPPIIEPTPTPDPTPVKKLAPVQVNQQNSSALLLPAVLGSVIVVLVLLVVGLFVLLRRRQMQG